MTRSRKPSVQTAAVLWALAHSGDSDGWRHGYDLARETGLAAGSLYPVLMRLADRGQLEASWEPSSQPGRPARHLYRLTPGLVKPAAGQYAVLAPRQHSRVTAPAPGGPPGRPGSPPCPAHHPVRLEYPYLRYRHSGRGN